MTKHIEIKPMVIPVINHAYGIDNGFDKAERATTMFEEISYEIFRCSHGLVKYEQDSFVRVNQIPKLDRSIICVPTLTKIANCHDLIHYLDWNRGISIFDRVCNGFKGEFWLYGEWFDDFVNIAIRNVGHIPTMGLPYNQKIIDTLEIFVYRLGKAIPKTDWVYEGTNPRKWLTRLPEKYWGNIKG